jgi:hypothetical protein
MRQDKNLYNTGTLSAKEIRHIEKLIDEIQTANEMGQHKRADRLSDELLEFIGWDNI